MGFVHDGVVVGCEASTDGFRLTDRSRVVILREGFRLWEFEVSRISDFEATSDHQAVFGAIELL